MESTMTINDYHSLTKQACALIESEPDLIANLANLSALLYQNLSQINWLGFYLVKGDDLVLAPFQGKPACVRIPVGRGVCGTAIQTQQVQRVADVNQFDGHIACDTASQSELVIPFKIAGKVSGVLDVDSPILARFSEIDQEGLTFLMAEVEKQLNSLQSGE